MSRYFGSGTAVPFREGYRIMKSRKVVVLGPRLVSAEAAPPTSNPDLDHEIAEGVRAYQRLQQQIDKELFSAHPDPEVVNSLWGQQSLVRDRLAAHGIRVRA
jgi:hypothetical protein